MQPTHVPVRSSILPLGAVLALIGLACPAAAQEYFGIDTQAPNLVQFDPFTGQSSSTTITLPGETVLGGTALTANPATDELWAILRIEPDAFDPFVRPLVTIDRTTGVATLIGDPGDAFAGLSFDNTGTLFGVTGDGAGTPETLFSLDQSNATPTLVTPLGNGDDGETIAFNFDDGLMYHASGIDTLNDPDGRIFESIDLATLAITPITLTSNTANEVTGLVYDGSGVFIATDRSEVTSTITTTGTQEQLATLEYTPDGEVRGIARIPAALPVSPD